MKKFLLSALTVSFLILLCVTAGLAIEVAPRISDREIVEKLSSLEEGQKKLETRLDDLRSEMNSRFESIDKRFESMDKRFDDLRSEMNSRFESMDKRFDLLTWIFGLFITISLVILGFVIRMQWLMQKRQTQTETTLQIQTDEVKFLKDMILKLFPPKGVL